MNSIFLIRSMHRQISIGQTRRRLEIMAFYASRSPLRVYISHRRSEFWTARAGSPTCVMISSLPSRQIDFVAYFRCALTCAAVPKLDFRPPFLAPESCPTALTSTPVPPYPCAIRPWQTFLGPGASLQSLSSTTSSWFGILVEIDVCAGSSHW